MRHPTSPRPARRVALAVTLALALVPACASTVATLGADASPADAQLDAQPDAQPDAQLDAQPDAAPSDAGGGWTVTVANRPLSLRCASGQWCWEHPLPQGESIFAARALPDGTTWAVGALGTALRFDGTTWTRLPMPTTQPMIDVWGLSQRDVWVVGQQVGSSLNLIARSLWRWDGSAWRAVRTPDGLSPMAVDGTSSTDVWLLSSAPGTTATTVWHYDGTAFSLRSDGLSTATTALSTLWVEAPGRVWAYGGDAGSAHATDVYMYNGTRWSRVGTAPGGLALQGTIGGAAGEVYVHATGFLGSRDRELVRLTDTALSREPVPTARGGYDDSVVSGNGTLWFVGAQLARRVAGAWQSVGVSAGSPALGVQPLTLFAPDAAGGGFGFNRYGDTYRSASATEVVLYSTPWRPRLTRLVGRDASPLGAAQLEAGALLVRSPGSDWAHPGGGPGGDDVRDLIVDDALRPAFALRSDNALVRLDAAGAPGPVVTPAGTAVTGASVNGGGAWAVAGNRALRFDGARFVPTAPLPALIGTLDSTMVSFDQVWSEGDHAYAAGGYRIHSEIPSHLMVLCDFSVSETRCVAVDTPPPGGLADLWSQGSHGTLWAVFDGALATIDRATLAVTPVPMTLTYQGAAIQVRGLRGNDRTGELIALSGPTGAMPLAVRVVPSARAVTLLPIPLSQYAAYVQSVYLGDGGEVWAMSESAQILRYTP